jgi:exopolysaccharide biosynthesis predicted pyruvyltransferase EpsI
MLDLFNKYGWTSPKAQLVLDPTLLLERKDYEQIISENDTNPSGGSMFCYILDPTPEKTAEVKQIAEEKGLKPFFQIGCMSADSMSIPQWLRSFKDADYVYTDSFHGLVFSLIFQKPATVKYMPSRRGLFPRAVLWPAGAAATPQRRRISPRWA